MPMAAKMSGGFPSAVTARMVQPSEPVFPTYTYVPGVTPHPVSSPGGHSYGHPPLDACDPEAWWTGEAFRRGVELFDAGYYWEAHEAWETTWKNLPRSSPAADFVKGLIKLAAGGVKCLEANRVGASRHFTRAMELLSSSQNFGLRCHFESLLRSVSMLIENPPVCASPSHGTPQVIIPFTLRDVIPGKDPESALQGA